MFVHHSDYFKQDDVTAVKGSTTVIVSEKMRNALSLRITAILNYVGSGLAWGNITWQVRCNGTPVEPFTAKRSQIGQPGIPQAVTMDFVFPPASLLEVVAINSDPANDYVAGIVLIGEYGTEK